MSLLIWCFRIVAYINRNWLNFQQKLQFSLPFCQQSLKQSRLKHKATAKAHRFIAQTRQRFLPTENPHLLCGRSTMLQKLSKCEVKAWLCWNGLFYRHSYFKWNHISNSPKMLILTILEILNFDFSKFKQLSSPKFTKNSKFSL